MWACDNNSDNNIEVRGVELEIRRMIWDCSRNFGNIVVLDKC